MIGNGLWTEIDEAIDKGIIQPSDINYDKILCRAFVECEEITIESWLFHELPSVWLADYNKKTQTSNEIVEFSDGHYQCLFDYNYERVVCFFGMSYLMEDDRDRSRQAGFIPRFSHYYLGKDRGHFMSHRQGGGMDVNFFPQKKEINRGWNAAGKIYRKMERYCSNNIGVFCFSRPLYDAKNTTWDPERFEYGIVQNKKYRMVIFSNR